jgi:hypothetical protein
MVIDGETGLLVDPEDIGGLARALQRLAGDRDLRRSMGAAGERLAAERFALQATSAQIGELFAGHVDGKPRVPSASGALCLIDQWRSHPGEEQREAEVYLREDIAVLVGRLAGDFKVERHIDRLPEPVEFLPDAMVLESAWRHDPQGCERLTALRDSLGRGLDGELFFTQARRAIHTATVVGKRGIGHVHAARSSSILWAWMVRLLTGCRASFAVEPQPVISRSVLERIIPDFDFGSVGDPRLAERLGGEYEDALRLSGSGGEPKRKLFGRSRHPDRTEAVVAWARRLNADQSGRIPKDEQRDLEPH